MAIAKINNNHLGFLPESRKRCVLPACNHEEFFIQDMQQIESEVFGSNEDWKALYRRKFRQHQSVFGKYLVGDFSELQTPGMYRVKILGAKHSSYQFAITDKAFHQLPFLLLDFIHNWRSGNHGLHWREPSNLDDDMPFLDVEGNVQWNTIEYWNTLLANCLMALSELLS
jgi:hypothetical protein